MGTVVLPVLDVNSCVLCAARLAMIHIPRRRPGQHDPMQRPMEGEANDRARFHFLMLLLFMLIVTNHVSLFTLLSLMIFGMLIASFLRVAALQHARRSLIADGSRLDGPDGEGFRGLRGGFRSAEQRGAVDALNLRLTLMNRDFDEADYEMLLALDEARGGAGARGTSGVPRSWNGLSEAQIEQFPVRVIPQNQDETQDGRDLKGGSSVPVDPATADSLERDGTSAMPPAGYSSWETAPGSDAPKASPTGPIQCAVCLEPCLPGDTVRTLACLHQFHRDCIDHWLSMKATCPVCTMDMNMR